MIDNTNSTKLSEETRTTLAMRNTAMETMRINPTVENIREFKMLRNLANKYVSKDKWKRSASSLQGEKQSTTDKWRKIKTMTGQKKFMSPQIIIEGNKHHLSPGDMASALNREYIRKVKTVISQIPPINIDPLVHYRRAVGEVLHKMSFKQLGMNDLVKIMDKMKPTGSTGADDISMRLIKDAREELQPLILILVNQSIKNEVFQRN